MKIRTNIRPLVPLNMSAAGRQYEGFAYILHALIQRVGQWSRPLPPERSQKWGFLSNTGPDSLKNHTSTKPEFNVGLIMASLYWHLGPPHKLKIKTLSKLDPLWQIFWICACTISTKISHASPLQSNIIMKVNPDKMTSSARQVKYNIGKSLTGIGK